MKRMHTVRPRYINSAKSPTVKNLSCRRVRHFSLEVHLHHLVVRDTFYCADFSSVHIITGSRPQMQIGGDISSSNSVQIKSEKEVKKVTSKSKFETPSSDDPTEWANKSCHKVNNHSHLISTIFRNIWMIIDRSYD